MLDISCESSAGLMIQIKHQACFLGKGKRKQQQQQNLGMSAEYLIGTSRVKTLAKHELMC